MPNGMPTMTFAKEATIDGIAPIGVDCLLRPSLIWPGGVWIAFGDSAPLMPLPMVEILYVFVAFAALPLVRPLRLCFAFSASSCVLKNLPMGSTPSI